MDRLSCDSRIIFRAGLIRGAGIGLGAALAFLGTALLAVTISGTVHRFQSGDMISAGTINENFDSLKNAIQGLPDCTEESISLVMSGTPSVADTTVQTLTAVTEQFDNGGLHDPGTPGRVTIVTPGRYFVSAFVRFATNATGTRYVSIRSNGIESGSMEIPAPSGAAAQLYAGALLDLDAGDTVDFAVQQVSGGSLALDGIRLSAFRICGN